MFYFATIVPTHVYFGEDGNMEKKTFLATWKDIPAANEIQFSIEGADCNAGELIDNIFFLIYEKYVRPIFFYSRWSVHQNASKQRLHCCQKDFGRPRHGLSIYQVH